MHFVKVIKLEDVISQHYRIVPDAGTNEIVASCRLSIKIQALCSKQHDHYMINSNGNESYQTKVKYFCISKHCIQRHQMKNLMGHLIGHCNYIQMLRAYCIRFALVFLSIYIFIQRSQFVRQVLFSYSCHRCMTLF